MIKRTDVTVKRNQKFDAAYPLLRDKPSHPYITLCSPFHEIYMKKMHHDITCMTSSPQGPIFLIHLFYLFNFYLFKKVPFSPQEIYLYYIAEAPKKLRPVMREIGGLFRVGG
jgi:hypothetical protein